MPLLTAALLLLSCAPALAHATGISSPAPDDSSGVAEPWIWGSLLAASLWYAIGVWRMRRRNALDRVIGPWQVTSFAAGILLLLAALIWPLDPLADRLFSAHMAQHLVLLLVAPPLCVAGRPAIAFLWAFARRPRKLIGRAWTGTRIGRGVQWLTQPLLVWLLFSGSFAFWHLPGPYQWAVQDEVVHALEHLSFFVTGLMFWTIVIEPSGRRRIGYGATLLFVATTAIVSALPGALIFLAPRPLYPVYGTSAAAWGLTPLEDQQLAGTIMWIPGGFVYLAAVLWVFAQWLREAERRAALALRRRPLMPLTAVALVLFATASGWDTAWAQSPASDMQATGGNAQRGAALIKEFGCGACHVVPGIDGADGLVGPPLTMIGRRIYIAGVLRNTPDNLMTWLRQPQQVVPGNAMPDMGISARDARDVAAYLYTLR